MTQAAEAAPVAVEHQAVPPQAPYRGIDSFRMADEAILFAREPDRRRLLRFVTVYRGVLLYGDSGVGKSSLVNAGLLPDARREGLGPERLRVQPLPGEEFVVERISPEGSDQLPFLPSLFAAPDDTAPRPALSAEAFLERVKAIGPEEQPLLVFDQFEEFFTLFEEAPGPGEAAVARQAQERVLDALNAVLNDRTLAVKLVFSFREEYLPKLNRLFRHHPELPDQAVRLTSPAARQVENIVAGPLRRFPERFGGRFSDELVDALAAAFRDRFQEQPVNLTEVQIACWQLWRAGNPAELFAQAGLSGLIERFFEEQLDRIPGEDRSLAMTLLARMVTQSGARNYLSGDDLIALARTDVEVGVDHLRTVLTLLDRETKLVRREHRQNVTYYTIVSEFLVPWIRERNGELVARREQERATRAMAEQRAEAQRALAEEREEARRRFSEEVLRLEREEAGRKARRARQGLGIAVVVILFLLGMVGQLARQQSKLRRTTDALADTAKALHLRTAQLQLKTAELQDKVDSLTLISSRLDSSNAALRRAYARSPAIVSEAIAPSAAPVQPGMTVPLVYIQFRGTLVRPLVEALRSDLNRAGFPSPGAERIDREFSNRVSYFRSQDRVLADSVIRRAEAFFALQRCPIKFRPVALPEYAASADPGQVEIWINANCMDPQ